MPILILSNVNVGLRTCGSTWTPIYSCSFFFLNITGCNLFLGGAPNLTIHIFFHHSYFVSSCCSELYRKLKKFQPVTPQSTLCFGCSSSVWDSIRPKDFPRLSATTHVRQLRLPSSQCWLHVMQSLRLLWCGHLLQPWKVLTDHFMLWRLCWLFLT